MKIIHETSPAVAPAAEKQHSNGKSTKKAIVKKPTKPAEIIEPIKISCMQFSLNGGILGIIKNRNVDKIILSGWIYKWNYSIIEP